MQSLVALCQTEAPLFTPQQVESLVTKRIESVVNGSAGLVRAPPA